MIDLGYAINSGVNNDSKRSLQLSSESGTFLSLWLGESYFLHAFLRKNA